MPKAQTAIKSEPTPTTPCPTSSTSNPTSPFKPTPSPSSKAAKKRAADKLFYGPERKTGPWSIEEDRELFKQLYPRVNGVAWDTVVRAVEGRDVKVRLLCFGVWVSLDAGVDGDEVLDAGGRVVRIGMWRLRTRFHARFEKLMGSGRVWQFAHFE
jgi:hypothetical protein